MSDAILAVQAAAILALEAHPVLSQTITGVFDGPPPRAPFPYISLNGGQSSDWSTKTQQGREVRLAVTIWDDGDDPVRLQQLMGHAEEAIDAMADDFAGWHTASRVFLRSLVTRNPAAPWGGLIEYRIRILAA
jgi:hypothetical protein